MYKDKVNDVLEELAMAEAYLRRTKAFADYARRYGDQPMLTMRVQRSVKGVLTLLGNALDYSVYLDSADYKALSELVDELWAKTNAIVKV